LQAQDILEGAEEFAFGEGPTGALLIHGFTGSPRSMVDLGRHLGERGISVKGIRLPGHGTTWEDLNTRTATDWTGAVEEAVESFEADHDTVFLVSLSFGGALSLDYAARHPGRVRGLVLLAPFVRTKDPLRFVAPLASKLIKSVPGVGNDISLEGQDEICYDRVPAAASVHMLRFVRGVRNHLDKVTAPALIIHGRQDHTSPASNAQLIFDGISSSDKELVWLEKSFHVITMDHERDDVFRRTHEFIETRSDRAV
jgi:carboxylesterase